MASIKVKFRISTVAEHEGSVFYQVIHERRVRQIPSDLKVFASEWDSAHSTVVVPGHGPRRDHLLSVRDRIRSDLERAGKIIFRLQQKGIPFSADDVVDEFRGYCAKYSVFSYMESLIISLRQRGRVRTSETYKATLNSFKKFRSQEDVMLDAISPEVMEGYEAWLRGRGVAPNTVSFYTRILRAVYNRAVEQDIIDNRFPFRRVYTGVDKTVKRALPLTVMRKIKRLDLSRRPRLDYARDMFLMSFYLRGMSFIDMAFLKKSDLKNGSVTYRRRKTGQQLTIGWTREMQHILDKYPENTTGYLLPIIRMPVANERRTYLNRAYSINRGLKHIAALAGIPGSLTLYVARHSWASAARVKGIPMPVISEGLGHESEATTRIYLASLDTSVVDRANRIILKSLG
ncbi:MAG: site-specific integrase [Muribaculaceae bacterium]|nr:site-specific integrase [Muribaculaceae bacterium]